MENSNNAPKIKWWTTDFGHTIRQRLYVNGNETPYFIDTAKVAAHKAYSKEHGLYGSGMHPKGVAATLGFGSRIMPLKQRAEQLAMSLL